MTEYRAQTIILKKLLNEKNAEIQELKAINHGIGDRVLEIFSRALGIVYSPPSNTILQDLYSQCSAITGNKQNAEISVQLVLGALQEVIRLNPDRRMIPIIEKITLCLEYSFMDSLNADAMAKKLELLLFGTIE
jgi:hypothetical protein